MTTIDEFRAGARDWLRANAKAFDQDTESDPEGGAVPLAVSKAFQKKLWEAGYAGIMWPVEYGGQGLGVAELLAFNEVAADFVLPVWPFVVGLGMPGPTLLELGTEEQKRRHLPPMLRGEEIWCQLFSEPDGGSDVASLRTAAVRTETGWRINGSKVWTSGAQVSDFGALLARTDPTVPKHQGITMFIVDMHHPGVTVRPLRVATGSAPFNEVHFQDVDVPADAVIGAVDRGWQSAVVMLRNERVSLGTGPRSRSNPLGFDSLLELARERGLDRDPAVRRRLAEIHAREAALGAYGRVLHEETTAGRNIGARGSAAKLAGAAQQLWAADLAQEILGEELALGSDRMNPVAMAIITGPGMATAGGTNEIQRNIIGERVLGLAKDPGVDRDLPFNQLRFSR
ncbi:acyl-CoA dehydrogenase family protein [Nocardia sp. alder85J]|uniref:acyl-CoA dehydrogenase family protein n=1 Tax=Nocardia sp. alder85J TaxID=2862949 RepID=UPI001CD66B49|nr:acyl-CoA dehydrogenase family protein [Nocardia sp. alder85J]MCX4090942.1 acyl-CoA dehydrogenase family protein [Nocardia sp. alder85J]